MVLPLLRRASLLRRAAFGVKSNLLAALNAFGFDIVRFWPDPFGQRRANLLSSERVDAVLDVGANSGQYGLLVRRQGYLGRLISFEPLEEAFGELSARAASDWMWDCHRLALGNEVGLRRMHVSQNLVSSSFLSFDEKFDNGTMESSYFNEETVKITRLDDLRSRIFDSRDRLFLKLDVQGFELSVLKGARESLQQVVAIECELSLAAIYEEQARLADVVCDLADEGFHVRAIEPAYIDLRTGDWLQVNGLFERR